MTRDDLERFRALDIDFESIGLLQDWANDFAYFCTPVNAEYVGRIGCDGIHFVLLPGDERVFCVDPAMGEIGTYVLPVAENFREFLSFLLFCRDANPLSQIDWMDEAQFYQLLKEDAETVWPGCETFFAQKDEALLSIAKAFDVVPADPFHQVKAMQAAFDPQILQFSYEYYDVLGIERD